MKKLLCFAFFSIFAFFGTVFADTIDIKWTLDNQTYTTTTCTVGGDVILPTPPTKRGYVFRGWKKSIFRGTFANWSHVPSESNSYSVDYHGNHTPEQNDYMVVRDAIDYISTNNIITLDGDYRSVVVTYAGASETFEFPNAVAYSHVTAADGKIKIARIYNSLNCVANEDNLRYGNNIYNAGETIFGIYQWNSTRYDNKIYPNSTIYEGTWRFVYDGVWETDGINGWKPAEQIINE